MFVIGTAGHVDHGKSSLVRALTGINPDRLQEEQEREMTIDLGFAWLTLPSGREVSIVDVPGHEDFIKNMLAGIGGIDVAMLVIAADEAIMPQTREHLQILDLLQVSHGVVALTKSDLIDDPEWLDLVQEEIREKLATTSLADAAIVPVSALTGQGLEQLLQALDSVLDQTALPEVGVHPRLPIDRVFTISGFGTVVTGTLSGGQLRVGDEIVVMPGGLKARIRGLQAHKTKVQEAQPGSRVAVNLTGVSVDALRRGQVITVLGALVTTQLVDARLRVVDDLPWPVTHNMAVEVFTGAERAQGYVRVLDEEELMPGQGGWVQLRLSEEIAVGRGDRYILRLASPSVTLGGGILVDPNPPRRHKRFRQQVIDRLQALASDDPQTLLAALVEGHGIVPAGVAMAESQLEPALARDTLAQMLDMGLLVALGETASSDAAELSETTPVLVAQSWQETLQEIDQLLGHYHEQYPLRLGMSREELKSRLKVDPYFAQVLQLAERSGSIVAETTYIRLVSHAVTLDARQQAAVETMMRRFDDSQDMPSTAEAEEALGAELLQYLVDLGRLVRVSDDVLYESGYLQDMETRLVSYLAENGQATVAQVRDLFGSSRKYALAFLEEMDRRRVTKRMGDVRVKR